METKDYLKEVQTSLDKLKSDFNENTDVKLKQALDGIEKKINDLSSKKDESVKATTSEIDALKRSVTELNDVAQKQGESIGKINAATETKVVITREILVENAIDALLNSKAFKNAKANGFKGQSDITVNIKDDAITVFKSGLEPETKAVSVTSNYTSGSYMITTQLNALRMDGERKKHIRQIMTVLPTDNKQALVPVVEGYDPLVFGAEMVAEGAAVANQGTFTWKDDTFSAKRLDFKITLTNDVLSSQTLSWIRAWLMQRIPAGILGLEDEQIMDGDGLGENLKGFVKSATSWTSFMSKTYIAGAFSSVATYDSGAKALVTFAANHNLQNGDIITIANSTNYNAAYSAKVISAKKIIIKATYVAESTAAWTAGAKSSWYHSIDDATNFDVLCAAIALMESSEFQATGILMNYNDFLKMPLSKATDKQYIGVPREAWADANINGVPIVAVNYVTAGEFYVGDFRKAMQLLEWMPLEIATVSDDTQNRDFDTTTFIAREKIILPLINPKWFMSGEFTTAKADLETA